MIDHAAQPLVISAVWDVCCAYFLCEVSLCVFQLVQLLSALDPDEPAEGHHFYFSMVPEKHINPNFTIRDNQGYIEKIICTPM